MRCATSPATGSRRLAFAARQAARAQVRSGLLAAAAAVGVAAALAADAYGEGGRARILQAFAAQGADELIVAAEPDRAVGGRARTGQLAQTLTDGDAGALRRELDGAVAASPLVTRSYRLRAGDLTKVAPTVGITTDYFRMAPWPLAHGALFDADAERRAARVAVLGATVSRDLFGAADPTGARIRIGATAFDVVGVLADRGQGLDGSPDDQVFVPLTTAMRRLADVRSYDAIVLQFDRSAALPRATARAQAIMSRRHRRFLHGRADFRVSDRDLVVQAQLAAFSRFSFFANLVGWGCLGLSACAGLSIGWLATESARREIGVRRCLGARTGDILLETLLEMALPAGAGLLAGAILGEAAGRVLAQVFPRPAVAGEVLTAAAALFSGAVVAAAARAARVPPGEALRTA